MPKRFFFFSDKAKGRRTLKKGIWNTTKASKILQCLQYSFRSSKNSPTDRRCFILRKEKPLELKMVLRGGTMVKSSIRRALGDYGTDGKNLNEKRNRQEGY